MDIFSERIKKCRELLRLSQLEVSKITGISNKSLSRYENGDTEPDLETLKRLSKLYKVSVDYLLGKTDNPNPVEEDIGSFKFALYGEVKDLTEEQQQTILDMARFLKDSNKK